MEALSGYGADAAQTGHVSVHEAGAIEYTGRKVLTIPAHDGKMDATELEALSLVSHKPAVYHS